ncbi:dipeptide ABC transporter ATP-binding protein [Mycolicibacterium confluentis]|uniref:ABC transporter ATP-binding protein n=1 Tax=Mycolicibacterium confluentis TaxID=28047 RepID=A0A7I7XUL4_9MYCO|nr:ABC transporter ATP-binding protein [Mycolicibacterium confluentis]MCV7322145.1 ABC transporter ATP-binding protein [Mycolicibacterium confluentis]ORV31532.1 ABC transporter ATP-binding protein [Mycolicibacterium confluentis]BBZ32959.1 ABC transporter ATP-binding protein [Mycolicibacterium confluentis]
MSELLKVEDLTVGFGDRDVVRGLSFQVNPGECFAIVGESGSGKSVTARTILGLAGPNAQVSASRLELNGKSLLGNRDRDWRRIRGREVGFVLQDALVSLDPLRKVGDEIAETLRLHKFGNKAARRQRVLELLEAVGVPEPELRARQLPGELSGGQRQRALIASAIALDPSLVIADEPTTALDVTVQAQILDLLAGMKDKGTGLVLISHDLAVVGRLADRVAVMRNGVLVEQGPVAEVLAAPSHPYTQALLDAVPAAHRKGTRLSHQPARAVHGTRHTDTEGVLLQAKNLVKRFRGPDGVERTAVSDVSFEIGVGETLGIVGESGSGKTTTARMALALTEPDEGSVHLLGEPWSELTEHQRRPRRRRISVVYQDPLSSFDPRWSVRRILTDALPTDTYEDAKARDQRAKELLDDVGLGEEHLDRRPLLLSGGQRQRVAIARALAPEPSLIVCDEPVSALDVTIQAQVLDLLTDLQEQLGLSYLFISHDLGVIHHVADRVLVMREGRVVETGTAEDIFDAPQNPYTQELLASLPQPTTGAAL